ncbi:RNA-binding protein [Oceanibaculum nanhaiense]|uniref:RNA-binding protein n=1 Tax=Oceanibaculum nanhaiense TaxID=1909734 RepID=UPI000A3CB97E|nr:RNA-binding protein [Oceanibaculum nanhaiense]
MTGPESEVESGAESERDERRATSRRCIATGEVLPKKRLIRFVVGPDNMLVPDLEERLPGRGLWVSADRAALDRAAAKGLFSRAARATVRIPDGLTDRVEALLAQRLVRQIGLARRAGKAVAGYEKVRSWLQNGTAVVLLAAVDGAEDGRGKLRALAGGLPVLEVLRVDEMGEVFGRDRAVHIAIARGGLAERILTESSRLVGLRRFDLAKPSPGTTMGTAPGTAKTVGRNGT